MTRKGMPTLARDYPHIKGKCSGCKKPLPKYRQRWCSDECSHEAYIRTDPGMMRYAVEQRDKGICAQCGFDSMKFLRVRQHFVDVLCHGTDKMSYHCRRTAELAFRDLFHEASGWWWNQLHLWEGDHIVPLIEGGDNVLTNMRTLCIPDHKTETKALAARRAKARREGKCPGADSSQR
jgi:5-methylcytosine-specific restriction endonuclease McrA